MNILFGSWHNFPLLRERASIDEVLYWLACRIFLHWCKNGRYHLAYDNIEFSQIRKVTEEENERQILLRQEQEDSQKPLIDPEIWEQYFSFFDISFDLESSHKISRTSECHHSKYDEHGASEHVRFFMESALKSVSSVAEYIQQERSILLQIRNNQTMWVRWRLRYSLLFLQEIRRILNDKLSLNIPNEYSRALFNELEWEEWFIDPRNLLSD